MPEDTLDNLFGGDDLENRLYAELMFTLQATMEGDDITNELRRATVQFYLGELDQASWARAIHRPNPAHVISVTLREWKKDSKDLLAQFKTRNGSLREGWM